MFCKFAVEFHYLTWLVKFKGNYLKCVVDLYLAFARLPVCLLLASTASLCDYLPPLSLLTTQFVRFRVIEVVDNKMGQPTNGWSRFVSFV